MPCPKARNKELTSSVKTMSSNACLMALSLPKMLPRIAMVKIGIAIVRGSSTSQISSRKAPVRATRMSISSLKCRINRTNSLRTSALTQLNPPGVLESKCMSKRSPRHSNLRTVAFEAKVRHLGLRRGWMSRSHIATLKSL